MHRGIVCLLWSFLAVAQVQQRDPFDIAVQSYWTARNAGHFDEAAAKRAEARALLERVPVDSPQFGNRTQSVAQLYDNAQMTAQARAIVQDALSRADALGQSDPMRILLLSALANHWQQDRNLLKSLVYREKAVATLDATPPTTIPATDGPYSGRVNRRGGSFIMSSISGLMMDNTSAYYQLAELYQQLGRKQDAEAVFTKIRKRAKNEELASLYERQGQIDEAAALYKKQAEAAAVNPQSQPWQVAGPLQALANLYQREQRYGDAAATLEQAIASLDASGKPEARNQAVNLRQNLANILNQAGQTQAADQIHQRMLSDTQSAQDGSYMNVLSNYANFLGNTKRGAQAEELLKNYLATHANLQPGEESSLLFTLANVVRMSGDTKRAEEYQRAATEKQQSVQKPPPAQTFIAKDLQKAQSAANTNNIDEAFALALQAMDAASEAVDRDQVAWQVPSIASALVAKKAPDKADQLYQRLFGLLQSWSGDTMQPLLTVLQNYPRFLMQQKDRWPEVPAAIERYSNALTAARGSGTGWLDQVLPLTIEFERMRGSPQNALRAAQDLVALEESLSGTTSEPYFRATETLAQTYESTGDPARALPLHRQAVAIADAVFQTTNVQRGFTRITAAMALARQREFDEAERLANEAVAIAQTTRPPQPNLFTSQLEQIRRMKTAPAGGKNGATRFESQTMAPGTPGVTMTAVPGASPIALPPPKPKP